MQTPIELIFKRAVKEKWGLRVGGSPNPLFVFLIFFNLNNIFLGDTRAEMSLDELKLAKICSKEPEWS